MSIAKGVVIVIGRAANGYVVQEFRANGTPSLTAESLVFNDMGYASGSGESGDRDCLLKFIESHFAMPAEGKEPTRG